jgi:hypothetical protein
MGCGIFILKRMKLFETIQKNNFTLEIDPELEFKKEKEELAKRFIGFCYKELGLKKACTIKLVWDRSAHSIKTTAYWREADQLCVVYAYKRMLVDVMRSVAHELVHKQQFEQDRVEFPVPDIGGPIENEANAMAGVLIKKFLNYDPDGVYLVESAY